MKEIKLITRENIGQALEIIEKNKPLPWDVVIDKRPYYVVQVDGFIHTIGGVFGENDLWAYPRNEKPSLHNLIQYNSKHPVTWGLKYKEKNVSRCKWDETCSFTRGCTVIYRNMEKFMTIPGDMDYSIPKAISIIKELPDHPLELQEIDFDKKCIGRKVWWRSQPAIITAYVKNQGSVILEPDGINEFDIPAEFKAEIGDEDLIYEEETEFIKTSILDKNIYWIRWEDEE